LAERERLRTLSDDLSLDVRKLIGGCRYVSSTPQARSALRPRCAVWGEPWPGRVISPRGLVQANRERRTARWP